MSEHVVLADCRDKNGVLSSQVAYYPDSGSGIPQDVATVATASGQTALWVCATTVGLFTDTSTQFIAKLGPKVADGAYAGTGSNGYDSNNGGFRCWQKFSENYYTYGNTTCNMVYNCDHTVAPSTTATAQCATATATASTSASTVASDTSTSELSTSAVIGISIGAGVALLAAVGAAFLIWRHLRRKRQKPVELPANQARTSGGVLGMFKKSPLTTPAQEHFQGPPQPLYEMDTQGRTENSALPRPGELGGNVRAEMPTPESQYYMWYPTHGEQVNSPLDGPPTRP